MKHRLIPFLLTLLGLAIAESPVMSEDVRKPHIVFILSDDQGSYDVSYKGGEIKTPEIDKLAMSGTQLDQFYVQPVCTPTRACS